MSSPIRQAAEPYVQLPVSKAFFVLHRHERIADAELEAIQKLQGKFGQGRSQTPDEIYDRVVIDARWETGDIVAAFKQIRNSRWRPFMGLGQGHWKKPQLRKVTPGAFGRRVKNDFSWRPTSTESDVARDCRYDVRWLQRASAVASCLSFSPFHRSVQLNKDMPTFADQLSDATVRRHAGSVNATI